MAERGAHSLRPLVQRPWWDSPVLIAAVVLFSAVPLLYPEIPPLVDLFGHMGRYRVQLDLADSPWLSQYYDFRWAAIGNLGVDLLLVPLAPLIGLEPAVKLVVLLIPPMTVAGFLWVAREVHGRVPPTAYFALAFAYGHPFLFGFVNYALSMALAFLAFALWLALARQGRFRLRAIVFVPISVIVFFAHTYGWGALGLLCFSAEAVRQHDRGIGWFRAGVNAALHASVMALPVLIMLAWRSGMAGGETGDWFNWKSKAKWLETALRDRWKVFDIGSMLFIGLVLIEALRNPRLTFSRNLAFSGIVLVTSFIIIPRIVFGSAYADMRLVPYLVAALLLAIRFRGEMSMRLANALAILGLLFFAARIAGNTISLAMAANDQQEKLMALDHIPMGARVATFVGDPCGLWWPFQRNSHLGGLVVVRKEGFSNDHWVPEGTNLLRISHPSAGRFATDPSERVRREGCAVDPMWTINRSLKELPREAFDYVWLIDPPPFDPTFVGDMKLVSRGDGWSLYQIRRASPGQQPATRRMEGASAPQAAPPTRKSFPASG